MVTLLFTAVAVLILFGIGVYFWQKPAIHNSDNVLPPRPSARGLFEEEPSKETVDAERLALISQRQEELIREARNGERSAIDGAHLDGDPELYDRVLTEHVQFSDS